VVVVGIVKGMGGKSWVFSGELVGSWGRGLVYKRRGEKGL
jgi:hypothetical protein